MDKISTFTIEDTLNETESYGCIMDYKSEFKGKNKPAKFIIYKDDTTVDLEKYLDFLDECGLVTECIEEDDHYEVNFKPEDYKNTGHFMSAFTAVRYAINSYTSRCKKVPETALKIKKENPDVENLICLQAAHYTCIDDYPDGLHQMLKRATKAVTKEQYLKNLDRNIDGGNALQSDVQLSWEELHKASKKSSKKLLEKIL